MMKAYMVWANFESESDLLKQALQHVFGTDKAFRKYQHKLLMPEVHLSSQPELHGSN